MRRIFYFCPDFPLPSAGTKRLYRHVCHLNRLGFDAYIVHQKKPFILSWHGYEAPVIWVEDNPTFLNEDILVFPEAMTNMMNMTKDFPCRRIVIVLNWAYIHTNLPKGENWKDYHIKRAITPSPFIKDFVEWSMGLDVTLIDNFVDHQRYYYDLVQKKMKISYMARKDLSGEILHSIFLKKESVLQNYEWVHLKDLDEEKYSRHILESKIFLATSPQEGMPTSVLEAMASGCIVIGFSGVGGNDYMIDKGESQNCFMVENGNFPLLGKKLEKIIHKLGKNENRFDSIINNAVKTAQQFKDYEKEGESLKRYFLSLV